MLKLITLNTIQQMSKVKILNLCYLLPVLHSIAGRVPLVGKKKKQNKVGQFSVTPKWTQ